LTQAEANEYGNLKFQRRRENPTRSFEQIKADLELHRAAPSKPSWRASECGKPEVPSGRWQACGIEIPLICHLPSRQ